MALAGDIAKFGDPIGLGKGLSLVLVTTAGFFRAPAVMLGVATRPDRDARPLAKRAFYFS